MSFFNLRDRAFIFIPALLLIIAAFWATFQFVEPAPPKSITIATGSEGGAYYGYGETYAASLAASDIELNVKATAGSLENLALLKDESSGVSLALIQGGISSKQHSPKLMSLGRVFVEPVWVFTRRGAQLETLKELQGKRVAIGPENSGTAHLARQLLAANKLDNGKVELIYEGGDAAREALISGRVDAVFLVQAARSSLVQSLLRNREVELMNFKRAEAYSRNFPFLTKLILPQGAVDLEANIPANDVALVGASAALVAREDFHPALGGLMVEALKDAHGDGDMFQRIGEFPQLNDPEYQVSDDTERSYNEGVPFLQRYLPFWLASFLQRKFLLLLPIATVLFPVIKLAPMLYNWQVRNRILHWYGQLKRLETAINQDPENQHIAAHMAEIERIDSSVKTIRVPIDYADQFYHLRSAVSLVRGRLEGEA
ncbi:MAG: hypothetical protein DHS20C08_02480 [Rhodomicrobium sp.]|nr:MAG: hypothetical protein DHS20C08_02480 [Rhodomicrobium sp.]